MEPSIPYGDRNRIIAHIQYEIQRIVMYGVVTKCIHVYVSKFNQTTVSTEYVCTEIGTYVIGIYGVEENEKKNRSWRKAKIKYFIGTD